MYTESEKLYNESHMISYIKGYANSRGLIETQRALAYAREKHEGQFRKGSGEVPYIVHPLNVACHAMALGLVSDQVLAVALLHDICEDCNVEPSALPVKEEIQESVRLLTFSIKENETRKEAKIRYFQEMMGNKEAVIVKLLDRCNNVSFMVYGFTKERIKEYIQETRELVIPMLEKGRELYPEYNNAFYVLKYHILSVINSVETLLDEYDGKGSLKSHFCEKAMR